MLLILAIELVGYLGIVWLQATWYRRGEMTEGRFAVFQVAFISLFLLTLAFGLAPTADGKLLGVVVSLLWWPIGYLFARWVYRKVFIQRP